MKTNCFIIACLLLFSSACLLAQAKIPGPGDRMPYFIIPELFNSTRKSINSTDFNDKLLIIDFWATNCSGCVAALPKLQRLQDNFGNKIKILPVTYEPLSLVQQFWASNKYTKGLTLNSVVNDKVLNHYFKHKTIPHEVWIYKGEIIGITTSEYVDSNNIQKVLSGKKIDWPIKYDFYAFDLNKPLFKFDTRQIDTSITKFQYAAISGYRDSINSEGLTGGSGVIHNQQKMNIRAFFINQPILNSYRTCLSNLFPEDSLVKPSGSFYSNEIVWEVKNEEIYHWLPRFGYSNDWVKKYTICYESVFRDNGQADKEIYKRMIADMDNLLGLNVRWEKRVENVFTIEKSDPAPKYESTGKLVLLSTILYEFNQHTENPYLFSNIDPEQEIYLSGQIEQYNIVLLKEALKGSGYQIKSERKAVDKLIFSEIDGSLIKDAVPIKN